MPVITVFRSEIEVALCCDSYRYNHPSGVVHPIALPSPPVIALGEALIGSDYENHAMILMLRRFLSSRDFHIENAGAEQLYETWLYIHSELVNNYGLGVSDDSDVFQSSGFNAIVVTLEGVFNISSNRYVSEVKMMDAIGTGREYAIGAMEAALRIGMSSAMDIAKVGATAAIEFGNKCSLPIHSFQRTIKLNAG